MHGDPRVLGQTILLDRKPYQIVGVMPREFEFPLVPGQFNGSELWVPMSLTQGDLVQNGAWAYKMIGRLKPGISAKQAQQDAERVAQETSRTFPPAMASLRVHANVEQLSEITVAAARPMLDTLFLASVFATRLLHNLLFQVDPLDPVVLALAAIAIFLLALAASVIPARRAASIEPMQALRAE